MKAIKFIFGRLILTRLGVKLRKKQPRPCRNSIIHGPAIDAERRRTGLTRADGQLVPDDWCLFDGNSQPLARIYKAPRGPRDGQFWMVLVDAERRPFNGGRG